MRALVGLALVLALAVAAVPAGADIAPTSDAAALAAAMTVDPSWVVGAAFEALPPAGTPHAVADSALGGFPVNGSTYAILTSGDAGLADDPNNEGFAGANLGGGNVRGDTDYDVSVLRVDLDVPAPKNCARLLFRFLSEEYPEWVGSSYNDAFIAELNASTWTTSGSTISAPSNFAFDVAGDVVSINSTGVTGMTADNATGTTYDGATALLAAASPIPAGDNNGALPGNTSLYLSIFDQGDQILDSAVFLDGVAIGFVPDPGTQCQPGAKLPTSLVANPAIAEIPGQVFLPNLSARLTDTFSEGPLDGETIEFYATSAVTGETSLVCAASTNPDGVASCGGVLEEATAALGLGYLAVFAGDDEHLGATGEGTLVRVMGTDVP
ncbi:MAG: choice-of-anchor L domain-containing protein [Acidobacteria bacterium]|nr:choice-of-anchor L domain-containing protein [Acidobacteriota bacterium]